MSALGKTLLTLVAVTTSTGCFIADWNETHIYNPNWTAHAKFHNGQTMSMGLLLGLSMLYYVYRNRQQKQRDDDLATAALLGSLYWITQLSGFLYPGSMAFDEPWEGTVFHAPQLYISCVCLTALGLGWYLEHNA